MFSKSLFASLFLVSFLTHSAGTVSYLEVDNDAVLFSISGAKEEISPECVDVGKTDLWSLSLSSDSGRAIYSMMLTSMADTQNIALTVESAGDCGVISGIERAGKVHLVSQSSTTNTGSNLGVYNWDGTKRLGALIKMEKQAEWYYADASNPYFPQIAPHAGSHTSFYFDGSNCTGDVYARYTHSIQFNQFYANGKFFKPLADTTTPVSNGSLLDYTSGECNNWNGTLDLYKLSDEEVTIDKCGAGNCTIREDR